MHVLYIVPYVPSLVRIRPYNLIRGLAARGHRVTVWTVWSNEKERQEVEQLRPVCHEVRAVSMPRWRSALNCLRALPAAVPLQSVYSWQPTLVANGWLEDASPDVIHVEHLRGSRYGLALKSQIPNPKSQIPNPKSQISNLKSQISNPKSQIPNPKSQIPIVWDSVDCISLLFRQAAVRSQNPVSRWITRFELERTTAYEGWLLRQFDRALVNSPVDRQALADMLPAGSDLSFLQVLGQGVDLHYFTPGDDSTRGLAELVISGKMSYHANIAMVLYLVREIMPLVWAHRPDVQLTIAGADPTREILALEQQPTVRVTGRVEDIRPYLWRATAAVAPLLYGTGVQNKVLEAMACATPVIATPQALTSLAVRPGQEVLVGQEPAAFAEAVLTLLDDREQQRRIGWAGRRFVEANHDWAAVAAKLEGIYDGVIHNRNI